jgi:RND family efflux transporter MFP subunit
VEVAREQVRTAVANASENLLREEDVKAAKAALRQAEATVALARKQLEYTYIKSSISGEVSARSAEPGQVVAIGQAVISVVNLDTTYFKGDISEKEFGSVSERQHVRVLVDAYRGVQFDGTVAELYPAASTMSRSFSARIAIAKSSHKIKPGMFARGQIVTGVSKNVLLIPKDAIDERKGTQSVFTMSRDGTVKRHIVDVVRENRNYVEIQMPADLNAGDVVVTQGRQNLQEGSRVHVERGA